MVVAGREVAGREAAAWAAGREAAARAAATVVEVRVAVTTGAETRVETRVAAVRAEVNLEVVAKAEVQSAKVEGCWAVGWVAVVVLMAEEKAVLMEGVGAAEAARGTCRQGPWGGVSTQNIDST